MARARDPRQLVKEAFQIARDHGLGIVERKTATGSEFLPFRITPAGTRVWLGRYTKPQSLRTHIARLAGYR